VDNRFFSSSHGFSKGDDSVAQRSGADWRYIAVTLIGGGSERNGWNDSYRKRSLILTTFGIEFEELMFGGSLIARLLILACLAGLVAPVLVDAHHWWPRKPKKK